MFRLKKEKKRYTKNRRGYNNITFGFKGFEKGLVCRHKQYAENTVFKEDDAEICSRGMHFCAMPFHVWGYYAPSEYGIKREFARVKSCGKDVLFAGDKLCTKKLEILNKLDLKEFVDAGIESIEKEPGHLITDDDNIAINRKQDTVVRGERHNDLTINFARFSAAVGHDTDGLIVNRGAYSAVRAVDTMSGAVIVNQGINSALVSERDCYSVVANTGPDSQVDHAGHSSIVANTGSGSSICSSAAESIVANISCESSIESGSYGAILANTGEDSSVTTYGDRSIAISSGLDSSVSACGKECIAFADRGSEASGTLGNWIICTEYNKDGHLINVKAALVDGKKIKPNVFYVLKNGKFKEKRKK